MEGDRTGIKVPFDSNEAPLHEWGVTITVRSVVHHFHAIVRSRSSITRCTSSNGTPWQRGHGRDACGRGSAFGVARRGLHGWGCAAWSTRTGLRRRREQWRDEDDDNAKKMTARTMRNRNEDMEHRDDVTHGPTTQGGEMRGLMSRRHSQDNKGGRRKNEERKQTEGRVNGGIGVSV
ncbi:hypothetical protein QJS10_CPB12g01641 [Acorus calamus]|uniref:Uncharacterized protein n=1 Tax=Acorus calamus TaxID=4465 RepID=A0AAV9DMK6_ACOCL|nr:hypothetical protein QJS10_CPB12g01641 [Acorus calamus]